MGRTAQRRKKPEQIQQPVPPLTLLAPPRDPPFEFFHAEGFAQRQRQARLGKSRLETPSGRPPDPARRKLFQPPAAPPFRRAPVDPQLLAQHLEPGRRHPVPQRRNQHHHHPHVDPPPQKPHRGRSVSLAAALPAATKAMTPALSPLRFKQPPRLARVKRPVQRSSAQKAALQTTLFRKFGIAMPQQTPYAPSGQVRLTLFFSFFFTLELKSKPPKEASFFRGFLLTCAPLCAGQPNRGRPHPLPLPPRQKPRPLPSVCVGALTSRLPLRAAGSGGGTHVKRSRRPSEDNRWSLSGWMVGACGALSVESRSEFRT